MNHPKNQRFFFVGVIVLILFIPFAGHWYFKPEPPHFQGRPLSSWIHDLQSKELKDVDAAFVALDHLGATAVPHLIRCLNAKPGVLSPIIDRVVAKGPDFLKQVFGKRRDPEALRQQAAAALRVLGSKAHAAVPDLIRHLNDPNPSVGNLCELALIQIGPPGIPHLVASLKSKEPGCVRQVLSVLKALGPTARSASPSLLAIMSHFPSPSVALDAALTLHKVGGYHPEMLTVLSNCFHSPDVSIQRSSAVFAGQLGPDALSLMPFLERQLKSTDALSVLAAGEAVHAIQPSHEGYPSILSEMLFHPQMQIRWKAAKSLGRIAPEGVETLPELEAVMLRDLDKVVRIAAAESIGKYGTNAFHLVQALQEAAWDEDDLVRSTASQSLSKINPTFTAYSKLD